MKLKIMEEADIQRVVPLYMDYYNTHDECCWTKETSSKRIHQVWSHEDSYCLIATQGDDVVGFVIGHFEQYDDLVAYDLVEIVISDSYQGKGLGTQLILELELAVKEKGAAMVQLQAVNDEMHDHFYGKLEYKKADNLVIMTKWL